MKKKIILKREKKKTKRKCSEWERYKGKKK
jgi:hypothetical protein